MKQNNRGMTLVEVMTGFVILTISIGILATGFFTVAKLIGEGLKAEAAGQQLSADIVNQEMPESGVTLTMRLESGATVTVDGAYQTAAETETGLQYARFLPQEAEHSGTLDYTIPEWWYKAMRDLSNLSKAQLEALEGYGGNYASNDKFRAYLYNHAFPGKDHIGWSPLPDDVRALLPDAYQSLDFYIKPFIATDVSSTSDLVIYAAAGSELGPSWFTRLIYDHECKCWYWGDSTFLLTRLNTNTSSSDNYISWETLHKQIESPYSGWVKLEP